MDLIFDQALFYGGIAAAAIAVLTAIIYICICKSAMKRLMLKLEAEYGKREQKPGSKHGSKKISAEKGGM